MFVRQITSKEILTYNFLLDSLPHLKLLKMIFQTLGLQVLLFVDILDNDFSRQLLLFINLCFAKIVGEHDKQMKTFTT